MKNTRGIIIIIILFCFLFMKKFNCEKKREKIEIIMYFMVLGVIMFVSRVCKYIKKQGYSGNFEKIRFGGGEVKNTIFVWFVFYL